MMDLCPHGIDLDLVWTPANPPNCQPCFNALSDELDQLELNDPEVRDAAIVLADALDKAFSDLGGEDEETQGETE